MMELSRNLEDLEISLLLEALYQRYSEDFRGYQRDTLRTKLQGFMRLHELPTISMLQDQLLHQPGYKDALVHHLDGRERILFRQPEQMHEIRRQLVPLLRSCPAPQIWIPDCNSAEDVFGVAIILMEEGLHNKTRIFATSNNALLLNEARERKFSLEKCTQYQHNYECSGGTQTLTHYYQQIAGDGVFHEDLASNITWAQYNLGTDASFNEFEVIICPSGLADYTSRLRRRALNIFYESQPMFGLLNIPGADYSEITRVMPSYQVVSNRFGVYRRMR